MISIVIPTFNNRSQLLQNLKKNSVYFGNNEVVVVNDNPQIDLTSDLEGFRNLRLIQNKANLGFSGATDACIRSAKSKYVMLLNDDVLLINDRYLVFVDRFKDQSIFAVSFSQKEKNNNLVGKNRLYWARGMIHHSQANDFKKGPNAWAEGGACIIDKNKYLTLLGFDQIYNPFYWEDIDLSYQAWKNGYKVLFDPGVTFIHHHESTISKTFSKQFIKTIAFRNQFIFIWKNIKDFTLLTKHILFLPYNMLYHLLKGEKEYIMGFFSALKLLRTVLQKRNLYNKKRILSDKEILRNWQAQHV